MKERFIIHIDMDAFFASVEQRDRPSLRGKAVVVGADPCQGRGRGVVSACSYEARKYGISSAMPVSSAYRRCPRALFLPVNMKKYVKESEEIFKIISSFSPKVEKVSIDEAFVDISGSYHLFGTPAGTAFKLKNRIKDKRGLTASVGLAPNRFLAKLSSEFKKPDGFFEIKPSGVRPFLKELKVEKVWGVGEKSAGQMQRAGIKTVGDLAEFGEEELVKMFGVRGNLFYRLARGIDSSPVLGGGESKSVSHEHTFKKDTAEEDKIRAVILWLSDKVSSRLRKKDLAGRTVTLKLRTEDFSTFTRSCTLKNPLNSSNEIFSASVTLHEKFNLKKRVRLIGICVTNFSSGSRQFDLFESDENKKNENLDKAVDKIRDKHGFGAIYRAGTETG